MVFVRVFLPLARVIGVDSAHARLTRTAARVNSIFDQSGPICVPCSFRVQCSAVYFVEFIASLASTTQQRFSALFLHLSHKQLGHRSVCEFVCAGLGRRVPCLSVRNVLIPRERSSNTVIVSICTAFVASETGTFLSVSPFALDGRAIVDDFVACN